MNNEYCNPGTQRKGTKIRNKRKNGGQDMKANKATVLAITCVCLLANCKFSHSQTNTSSDVPGAVDRGRISAKVVEVKYVTQLEGVNARYKQDKPEMYRGLVLTLEVTKPAGEELKLYAQDFSPHYAYEGGFDIAPCQGISTFSTEKEADRPFILSTAGRGCASTGTTTTRACKLYVDLFFDMMESSTRKLHLMLARPASPAFETRGWN